VIAIDASHYSEIPNCLDMCEEIGAAGGPGGLNAIWGRSLKLTGIDVGTAKLEYGALSVAGRRLVGYFAESDTRSICLPSLLLAIRLIVLPYDLNLRWQWKCKDRLTGPINHLRLTRKARVLSNGHELVAQHPEVLS
jgi:hypothetical protein